MDTSAHQPTPRVRVANGTRRLAWTALLAAVAGAVLASCGGGKHVAREPTGGRTIDVAIVDTPNTEDLARLTPSLFTAKSHIQVNYTILDENTLRDVVANDVATRGRQFDVVMIGPYEAPQYAQDGYITDLAPMPPRQRLSAERHHPLDPDSAVV